jgi:deoxyribonuclease IV
LTSQSFHFGTVGSPISTSKKPGGSVGAIIRLRELELDALELGWVNSVRVSEATCQLIKETGQEHQVHLSVHAPYFINLNADDEEWPKSRKRLMDAAHYGNLAGASDIVFILALILNSALKKCFPTPLLALKVVCLNCARQATRLH